MLLCFHYKRNLTSIHFKLMPEIFKKCLRQLVKCAIKVQMLALHIQVCQVNESASSNEEAEVQFVSERKLEEVKEETSESVLPCPICQLMFPVDSLEVHASLCVEQNQLESPDYSSVMDDDSTYEKMANSSSQKVLSLEDLLELIASRVNGDKKFHICVSRDNLLERGFKQWQRQKKGNPVNQLKVTFIGEAGVDSGALRKEFLTGK
ncbi:hypothetical protein Q8A67_007252 [Cirrhinus molitorella]|uniref:HECT domain-containing protein n=1 Tax=Cirrhinus molitorella TaxID=172907 RepID=A0AA88Q066_9TELE|nr:hypothetical protein Q8A67_007252 [Cirrhinus molitorella]